MGAIFPTRAVHVEPLRNNSPEDPDSVMGPYRPPKSSFNAQELEALDLALDAAWAKLSGGVRDPREARAVKDFLRRKILQIAKAGVVDPCIMSSLALNQLPRSTRHL